MRLPVSPDPNICGVVRADVHTGEGHHDGEHRRDGPPSPVDQQQSDAERNERRTGDAGDAGDAARIVLQTAVDVGDDEQYSEEHDAVLCVCGEESVRPPGSVGEAVDPAEEAVVHSGAPLVCRSRYGWREAFEDSSLSGPGVDECLGRDATCCVTQRDGGDVVEGPDHGQELRDEIDRREHPKRCERDGDFDALGNARVLAEAPRRGVARGQDHGKVFRKTWREPASEHDITIHETATSATAMINQRTIMCDGWRRG